MNHELEPLEPDSPDELFSWQDFEDDLKHYVQLELAGNNAEAVYPECAFHINTSVECRDAYLHELHRQSHTHIDDALLQQARQLLQANPAPAPAPYHQWLEQAVAHGRGWLERATQQWRQVEILFSELHAPTTGSPAYSGLMGDEEAGAQELIGALQVMPEDANFELTVRMSSTEAGEDAQARRQAEITVTMLDTFGDYSGIDVYLTWDDQTQHATTDALGRVYFTDLPAHHIKIMRLTVVFPEGMD